LIGACPKIQKNSYKKSQGYLIKSVMCQIGGVIVKLNISGAKVLEHFKRFLLKVSSFDFGPFSTTPPTQAPPKQTKHNC